MNYVSVTALLQVDIEILRISYNQSISNNAFIFSSYEVLILCSFSFNCFFFCFLVKQYCFVLFERHKDTTFLQFNKACKQKNIPIDRTLNITQCLTYIGLLYNFNNSSPRVIASLSERNERLKEKNKTPFREILSGIHFSETPFYFDDFKPYITPLFSYD